MKTRLCIAAAAALAVTTMAGPAQAKRLVESKPASFISGESFETPIKTSCIKTGTDPRAVANAVMACYIKALQSQQPRDTVISDATITNWSAPKPSGLYLIKWSYYYKGRFLSGGQSGQTVTARCDSGGLFSADFWSCQSLESVSSCIERQDLPNRTVRTKEIGTCQANEAAAKSGYKTTFAKWLAYGTAGIAGIAKYMLTFEGAGLLTGFWSLSSGYSWSEWVAKCEAFANGDAHKKEQVCEAAADAKWRKLNAAIVKDCNT